MSSIIDLNSIVAKSQCVYVCVYTYIYINTHTHTHIHIHMGYGGNFWFPAPLLEDLHDLGIFKLKDATSLDDGWT